MKKETISFLIGLTIFGFIILIITSLILVGREEIKINDAQKQYCQSKGYEDFKYEQTYSFNDFYCYRYVPAEDGVGYNIERSSIIIFEKWKEEVYEK